MARLRKIADLGPFRSQPGKPGAPREVATSRKLVPDYIEARTNGKRVAPEVAIDKPCTRKGKGTLRKCHVELSFLGARLATEAGVTPGAYLRMCARFGGQGTLVPVANHVEASTITQTFCECRKRGDTPAACARKIGGRR